MASTSLKLQAVNAFYGHSHVLFDLTLEVKSGEIVYLLGRNGAGKTTTMKTAAGVLPPRSGKVFLGRREISAEQTYRIARLGLGYVPGNRCIFTNLTVAENLEVARKPGPAGSAAWGIEQVFAVFPALERYMRRKAGLTSGGEQQMLATARALMGNPSVLMLDEPMEGLAPMVIRTLEDQFVRLREDGVGLLISDSNLRSAARIGDRAYVIERGTVVFHDEMARIVADATLVEKYLTVE